MEEVSIIGIDLAKRSFQVHGAQADGSVAYRKKLSRGKLLGFLASQPACTVAMEACASAHYWGREIGALGRIDELDEKIDGLDRKIRTSARDNEETARLMTIPGIGPVTAMALQAFAPPMESFRSGRDFSAWLGLVPRQHTTGGKPRLGRISKMGQRDLRRLLVTGAMAVIRHASRRGEITDPWLAGMLARKPKKLVAVALGAEGLGAGHKEGDLPGSRRRLSGPEKGEKRQTEKQLPGDVGSRTQGTE